MSRCHEDKKGRGRLAAMADDVADKCPTLLSLSLLSLYSLLLSFSLLLSVSSSRRTKSSLTAMADDVAD